MPVVSRTRAILRNAELGLLRRRRENTRADTATLWAAFKRWSVCLFQRFASALSDQLANCRQSLFSPFIAHK